MKSTKNGSVKLEEKAPFAQRHPRINFVIGLVLLVILVFAAILLIIAIGRYHL